MTPCKFKLLMEFWSFITLFFNSQIVTGIVLAMFYNPNSVLAFTIIMD